MPAPAERTVRVLHVDDDPDFAELAATFLERRDDGLAVETAPGADRALELLADRPPDCIVSDYDMPRTDGLELLERVRADHPELPFVLFTGKGSETVAADAIAAGATDYLRKRHGTEQYTLLAERVLNAVARRRSERRLRATRAEHAAVLETAREGLLVVAVEDGMFRYRRCNRRALEALGSEEGELVGRTPREALGPGAGREVAGALRASLRRRRPLDCTVTFDRPDGRVRHDCRVVPVRSDDGARVERLVVALGDAAD